MKILLLYKLQILRFEQSWYYFYSRVLSYLKERGYFTSVDLYVAFLLPMDEKYEQAFSADFKDYNFIKLPDSLKFNTSRNRKAILEYIDTNSIDCIFNLMHPNIDLIHFLKNIRVNSECKILNVIHNRPDLVVFNKRQSLSNSNIADLKTLKERMQKLIYPLFIRLFDFYVKRINIMSYKLHDGIILLSDSYIGIYKKMINRNAMNIYAIPNPAPNISSKIPIEDKKNEIIFVGHLTKVKAGERLLSIWHKIQDKNREWSLLIVGDGPEKIYLESIVRNDNLKRVQFLGRVKSINYIDSAKILCLVSNFEGLPTVFLEAMCLGVVPIGYDTFPAIHDMIDTGKTGYIVPFEDSDQYASILLRLAADDKLRCELAQNAKLKSAEFSLEIVAEKWLKVFKKVGLLE